MNWTEALQYCKSRGGSLAEPTDSLIQSTLENLTDNQYWIGATDADSEGFFQWISGAAWSYTNWASGQPDDHGNDGEDCVHLRTDGTWNDLPCNSIYAKPLCQYTTDQADGKQKPVPSF